MLVSAKKLPKSCIYFIIYQWKGFKVLNVGLVIEAGSRLKGIFGFLKQKH